MHILSSDTPFRLGDYQPGLTFHRVDDAGVSAVPRAAVPAVAGHKIVQVARESRLDIVHAHYAMPHATAAYLARQILLSAAADRVPQVITTLHGTDITLLGSDHSYAETVAFWIEQSDGVTAVSESLKADTYRMLPVRDDIRVIPNFLDCEIYRRPGRPAAPRQVCPPGCEKVVIHVSNFRPVKRVTAVVEVFARICGEVPSRLLMVGDGPDLTAALDAGARARRLEAGGLRSASRTSPAAAVDCDLFLLPSAQESFGLAALEAMACEVPVVASRVGGLHEVIDDGSNTMVEQMYINVSLLPFSRRCRVKAETLYVAP